MSDSKAKKWEVAAADMLRYLHSHNFNYAEARCALDYAQTLLQQMVNEELNHLPIAGGVEDIFKPDHLVLSSKCLIQNDR